MKLEQVKTIAIIILLIIILVLLIGVVGRYRVNIISTGNIPGVVIFDTHIGKGKFFLWGVESVWVFDFKKGELPRWEISK